MLLEDVAPVSHPEYQPPARVCPEGGSPIQLDPSFPNFRFFIRALNEGGVGNLWDFRPLSVRPAIGGRPYPAGPISDVWDAVLGGSAFLYPLYSQHIGYPSYTKPPGQKLPILAGRLTLILQLFNSGAGGSRNRSGAGKVAASAVLRRYKRRSAPAHALHRYKTGVGKSALPTPMSGAGGSRTRVRE